MSDNEITRQLGENAGRAFGDSLISQLEAIAAARGVRVASLTTGDDGRGPASRYGIGTSRAGRRTGDGETHRSQPERPYTGEKVLGENVPDAARDPNLARNSAAVSAAERDPNAAKAADAMQAAARDPNAAQAAADQEQTGPDFTGTASTYNPNKPGWKSGGQETASGERYSDTAYTAAIQQQLAHQFWPEGKMGYGKNYQPRYFEAEDPKTGKRVIFKANDIMPFKGRSFDLNEATMKYLDPSMKKGVLPGLKFRALPPGKEYQTGPVNAGERPVSPAAANPASVAREQDASTNNGYRWYDANPKTGRPTAGAAGVEPHFPVSDDVDWKMMDPEYLSRVNAAYDQMSDEDKSKFRMISGYRPAWNREADELGMKHHSSQEDIWRRFTHPEPGEHRPQNAARPGHSRHEPGMAGDFENYEALKRVGKEFGLTGIGNDPPHVQLDPRYKGNFYNPNKPADQQQATIGPNGEMLVFGGLRGQLDRESAARIAAAKGLTPKYFDYRDTEAALKYARGLDRPYESMGFSAGVNSQERFAEEARKRGIQLPRGATAVGQYAPEGGRQKLPNNSGVPTEHYLDPSGKGLKGQVPEGHYLEGHHMPTQGDAGTMARAADAIEARIAKEKAAAAQKEVPEAARNPAAAKPKDEPKEAKKDDK
jgi:rare lipoprotein A